VGKSKRDAQCFLGKRRRKVGGKLTMMMTWRFWACKERVRDGRGEVAEKGAKERVEGKERMMVEKEDKRAARRKGGASARGKKIQKSR
jgi:hypothetical protein